MPLSSKQCHCSLEGYELAHARHVDAVAVREPHLRRTGDNHHLAGIQSVENPYYRLFQNCSAHYAVVYDNEVVTGGSSRR